MKRILLLGLAWAGMFSTASAGTIFDNGVTDLSSINLGSVSDISDPGTQQTDDFQLDPGQTTIRDVHWTGIYINGDQIAEDDFTIRIFADNSGTPAINPLLSVGNLTVQKVDSGVDHNGYNIFQYDVGGLNIALNANTTYWLSIVNDTVADSDSWCWAGILFDGNSFWRQLDGDNWNSLNHRWDFTLTDDVAEPIVPEPASVALLLTGLLGISAFRNRVRKPGLRR